MNVQIPVNMQVSSVIPHLLDFMVAGISVVTIILMIVLTIKIYNGEARREDAGPKNKGW